MRKMETLRRSRPFQPAARRAPLQARHADFSHNFLALFLQSFSRRFLRCAVSDAIHFNQHSWRMTIAAYGGTHRIRLRKAARVDCVVTRKQSSIAEVNVTLTTSASDAPSVRESPVGCPMVFSVCRSIVSRPARRSPGDSPVPVTKIKSPCAPSLRNALRSPRSCFEFRISRCFMLHQRSEVIARIEIIASICGSIMLRSRGADAAIFFIVNREATYCRGDRHLYRVLPFIERARATETPTPGRHIDDIAERSDRRFAALKWRCQNRELSATWKFR